MPSPQNRTQASLRRHVIGILGVTAFLLFGMGTLAATTQLAGAVLATGAIVVKSSVKKIRHTTGGIVAALAVQDGSRVKGGDLLLRLDETTPRATRDMIVKEMWDLDARRARLEAEQDGRDALIVPPSLADNSDPDLQRTLDGERRLFVLRRNAREIQRRQLQQRILQLKEEIKGSQEQNAAKELEQKIVANELIGVRDLYNRNLVQLPRLDALERDAARIAGERGQLTSSVAQTGGKIAETELKIAQIDDDLRSDTGKELADIRAKRSDLAERRIVAEDQLAHLDVRAAQSGYVHDLNVHAAGAVLTPGEDILTIVPDDDVLVAQVHVRPQDIDKVAPGQTAMLRFPNFDGRTNADVKGEISRVAADVSADSKGGTAFYAVDVTLDPARAGGRLRPGMPVDAFIATSERTMLAYLMKPLSDQITRAFREK
jgi:HlyD family secretion protein